MSKIKSNSYQWIRLSVVLFGLAALAGLLASIVLVVPSWNKILFSFREFRPLHTFFSLMAIVAGVIAILRMVSHAHTDLSDDQNNNTATRSIFLLFILFLISGSLLTLAGFSNGREYFSWYPMLTLLFFPVLFYEALSLIRIIKQLIKASPEGVWLLGLGLGFVIGGLVESHLWLIPKVGLNTVKDLTVQWHGIDTFVAGLNAMVYGGGVFIVQKKPKTLRKKWMFGIAGFSILFTFGHHHYVSPQPHYLKILAFLASMVAMISFIRHVRSYKKVGTEQNGVKKLLLKSIEVWTLIAVGSGILYAVPQVNLFVHGTYLIVIHAMGSMIGVNLLMIWLAGLHYSGVSDKVMERSLKNCVRGVNYSLIGLWIFLGLAGLIKGVMRIESNFWVITDTIRPLLYTFPLLGLILTISILRGGQLIWRINRKSSLNS